MGVDPVSIAVITMAAGSIYQGIAGKQAADRNAANAEKNAEYARQQAVEEERRQRIEGRKSLGSIRAGYGASGVTLEGSALDVLAESAANNELDALSIRHRGERQSSDFLAEADSERASGNAQLIGGYMGGASRLIDGAERSRARKKGKQNAQD